MLDGSSEGGRITRRKELGCDQNGIQWIGGHGGCKVETAKLSRDCLPGVFTFACENPHMNSTATSHYGPVSDGTDSLPLACGFPIDARLLVCVRRRGPISACRPEHYFGLKRPPERTGRK